jgi:hypothetical protein
VGCSDTATADARRMCPHTTRSCWTSGRLLDRRPTPRSGSSRSMSKRPAGVTPESSTTLEVPRWSALEVEVMTSRHNMHIDRAEVIEIRSAVRGVT